MCRICYSHGLEDFGTNSYEGADSGNVGSSSVCCNYSTHGTYLEAFDCIIIAHPSTKTNGEPLPKGSGHFCGEALVTTTGNVVATVCSKFRFIGILYCELISHIRDRQGAPISSEILERFG